MARTVFYGVGNDGYFTDVIGIETALSGVIGSDTFSSYTYSNLADMCYAGGLVGGTGDLNTVSGLTFFGSSSELDLSYAFSRDSYSLFTNSLISGLSNWTADSDNDGILLVSEWFQYSYDATVGSF